MISFPGALPEELGHGVVLGLEFREERCDAVVVEA